MKKITINTIINDYTGITVQYKMGNWIFAWYNADTRTLYFTFKYPKYCGIDEEYHTQSVICNAPTKSRIFPMYRDAKFEFEKSYAVDRLEYYQKKMDNVLT